MVTSLPDPLARCRPPVVMHKLTNQIFALLVIPLLIAAALFGALYLKLTELEKHLMVGNETTDSLSRAMVVLNDVWVGSGTLMLWRATRDDRLLEEAQSQVETMKEHLRELKEAPHSPEIDKFAARIEDMEKSVGTFCELSLQPYSVNAMRSASKFRALTRRLSNSSFNVINSEIARVKDYSAQDNRLTAIIQGMLVGSLGIILVLMVGGFLFSLAFSRKWNILLRNTSLIAAGKPLSPPISSKDELGMLDRALREMAQELASAREREMSLIDMTAEVICSLDPVGRLSEINPAVKKRFGFEPADVKGMNVTALLHPEERQEMRDNLRRCMESQGHLTCTNRLRKYDGGYAFVEWSMRWSERDGRFFCVVLDITARVEADRLKQEVLSMVSHDLRTPLTSIKLALDCTKEGVFGPLNQAGLATMGNAQSSADYLINMINDLLDIEKDEAGGLTLYKELVDVLEVLQAAVDTVKPDANSKNIRIEIHCDEVEAMLDVDRIRRTLVNLLGNAIKFSEAGSRINLACRKHPAANILRFSVRDFGSGIPAEKLGFVFEKYRQVGTGSDGERKGSGLGLAICKRLVEAHGGTIGVVSRIGEGSEFWFELPRSSA